MWASAGGRMSIHTQSTLHLCMCLTWLCACLYVCLSVCVTYTRQVSFWRTTHPSGPSLWVTVTSWWEPRTEKFWRWTRLDLWPCWCRCVGTRLWFQKGFRSELFFAEQWLQDEICINFYTFTFRCVCVCMSRVTWRVRSGVWLLTPSSPCAPPSAMIKPSVSGRHRPIIAWSPSASWREVRKRSHMWINIWVLVLWKKLLTDQYGRWLGPIVNVI